MLPATLFTSNVPLMWHPSPGKPMLVFLHWSVPPSPTVFHPLCSYALIKSSHVLQHWEGGHTPATNDSDHKKELGTPANTHHQQNKNNAPCTVQTRRRNSCRCHTGTQHKVKVKVTITGVARCRTRQNNDATHQWSASLDLGFNSIVTRRPTSTTSPLADRRVFTMSWATPATRQTHPSAKARTPHER